MISLVLVVCLATAPDICREENPPIDAVGPMACMVQGQQIAAEWVEEHPKWSLQGWRCHFGRPQKQA